MKVNVRRGGITRRIKEKREKKGRETYGQGKGEGKVKRKVKGKGRKKID